MMRWRNNHPLPRASMLLMARNRAAALCLTVLIAALATPLLCEWRCSGSGKNPITGVVLGHHSHVTHASAPAVVAHLIEPVKTSACVHDDATVDATTRASGGSAPLSYSGQPYLLASTLECGALANRLAHLDTARAPRGLPPPLARVLRL